MKPKKYTFQCDGKITGGKNPPICKCAKLELFDFQDGDIELGGVILSTKLQRKLLFILAGIVARNDKKK